MTTLDRVRKHIDCEYVYEWTADEGPRIRCSMVGEITFAKLAALSEEFGTRLIDVECDTGTGSDPCHDRVLIISNPTR